MSSPATLATLLRSASLDDHTEILNAANAALRSNAKDKSAQVARVVALLKLDRFGDALRALEEGGEALKKNAALEYAYALYKVERLQEAQEAIQRYGAKSPSMQHMEAQVAYRRGDPASAAEIYEGLASKDSKDEDTESDIKINRMAVDAHLSWLGMEHLVRKKQPDRQDLEQFENAFNAASAYMARGDVKQSEFLLKRARDLCNTSEELTEDEKKTEVAPIETQLACVLCWQGKHDEAKTFLSASNVKNNVDQGSRVVAQVNQLVAAGPRINSYLAQRAFMSTSLSLSNDQLVSFQRSVLERDALTLNLHAHKFGSVSKGSFDNAWAGVYGAAAHARNQTGEKAIKELLPLLERKPLDVGLLMTIVQLYAITNNLQTATSLVETFLIRLERSTTPSYQDVRFSPGVVGLLVSLYAGQHRIVSANMELLKSARHWRRKIKDENCPLSLLKAAGAALLESPLYQDQQFARELFQLMVDEASSDQISIAGLTAASGQTPVTTRRQDALQPIEQLTAGIDVSTLELDGAVKLRKQAILGAGVKRAADPSTRVKTSKKIRKSRQPKDFDPNKKPDPERWLPLRDRSSWKPKGKKKAKASQGMSTQGGVATEESNPPQQQQQSKATGPSKSKKKKGKGGK